MEIFKWLDNTSLVAAYTVRDFRTSPSAFYLNLHVQLIDQSELYVRDFRSADHRKYSFHWQTSTGALIACWDNAPHFPDLTNFPHHQHLAEGPVVASHSISLDEVMTLIAWRLEQSPRPE